MSLSNVEREVILRGGPENDHPTGDFVWPCMHCDAEFHGEQYEYICYKCAQEEDAHMAEPEPSGWPKALVYFVVLAICLIGCMLI